MVLDKIWNLEHGFRQDLNFHLSKKKKKKKKKHFSLIHFLAFI